MSDPASILTINPTYAQLARLRRHHPVARIVCCTQYRLKYPDHAAVDHWYLLDTFLPERFESQFLQLSEEVVHALLDSAEIQVLFRLPKQNLLQDARFHYLTKTVYPIVRAAVLLRGVMERHSGIQLAYADDPYFGIFRSFRIPSKRLSRRGILQGVKVRLIPFAAILYKLLLLPLVARTRTQGDLQALCEKTLLIGNINEFVQFKAELAPLMQFKHTDFAVLHPMRKYRQYARLKCLYPDNYSFLPLDHLLSWGDYFIILGRYLRIAFAFPGQLRRYFRPRLFGHPLGAVLRAETYSFFLYFSLVALKNIRSMERLLDRLDGQPEVVFSHPHTFLTNTMNNFLRAHGFKTMTYNHGLIQGPLQLITETGINHSASRYDLEVMRKFSRDDTFKHIYVEAQPRPVRQEFRDSPEILILGSIFHPSIHFEYMRDYLSRLKDCIFQTGLTGRPLLYKPHPRENYKRLATYLREINCSTKIAGHDLRAALDQSNFAITHFSTAIIECVKMGVPFMIYRNFTESDETFFVEIPGSICFSDPKEFADKYHALVQVAPAELNALYNDLYEKYYHGQPGQ